LRAEIICGTFLAFENRDQELLSKDGAGDGNRTRNIQLGNPVAVTKMMITSAMNIGVVVREMSVFIDELPFLSCSQQENF